MRILETGSPAPGKTWRRASPISGFTPERRKSSTIREVHADQRGKPAARAITGSQETSRKATTSPRADQLG